MSFKNTFFSLIIAAGLMMVMPAQANTLGDIARMVKGQAPVNNTNTALPTGVQPAVITKTNQSAKAPAKWQNIKRFMNQEAGQFVACMADQAFCDGQMMRLWHRLVTLVAPMETSEKLRSVNRFFNAIEYKTDRDNYGQSEYWATPAEFMTHGGDCEDYAIAKYFTLRLLGISDRDMRITNVYDNLRQIGHSVVAVRRGDTLVYLDNRTNGIFDADLYTHYTPYYSVNQSATIQHATYRPVAGQ
jgi:predicted transglutaminase-like cysteine proteinase